METRSQSVRGKGKAKSKHTKHRKNMQKPKYLFNRLSRSGVEYADYFNPDQRVEGRMLGLPQLVCYLLPSFSVSPHNADIESKLQISLQAPSLRCSECCISRVSPASPGLSA